MRILCVAGLLVAVATLTFVVRAPAVATDYLTQNFDNQRSGYNGTEDQLGFQFSFNIQKLTTVQMNGSGIDAQPLYLSSEATPLGQTNVVYVATEDNHVYAYSPAKGQMVWTWSSAPYAPVPSSLGVCNDTWPQLGITSTPVIDKASDTIYFVANTIEGNGQPVFRLHALSAGTGVERPGSPSAPIIPGNEYSQYAKQRAGLLESNGLIYIAFGSHCDVAEAVTWGRVYAHSASTLQQIYSFRTQNTSNTSCVDNQGHIQFLGSVWMSGGGLAADASGNIYFTTGNGCVWLTPGNYAQAMIRLTPQLTFPTNSSTDTFFPNGPQCQSPYTESSQDLDYGSGGVALHTDPYTGRPVVISGGKDGVTHILYRNASLGGWPPCSYPGGGVHQLTNNGMFSSPAVFDNGGKMYIAISDANHGMQLYTPGTSCCNSGLQLLYQSNEALPNHGASAFVTSNYGAPDTMGLWYLKRPAGATGSFTLEVFSPAFPQLSGITTYSGVGYWGNTYGGIGMITPVVVDGYVFVASYNGLEIWSVPGNIHQSGKKRSVLNQNRGA